ncbi:hypothetical protein GCM10009830_00330 [Glycomyces endophyticus]|uniref:Uncharacterized protein n=1 Tax=Glycomyces endophyticus TaxID=480996 RepID=A0ABP4RPG3_9ACTN
MVDRNHHAQPERNGFALERGFPLYDPPDATGLGIAMLAVQIAARACAIHDEGATITQVVSHPEHRPGIGYIGESDYDPDVHGRSALRDPVMIAAVREYSGELTRSWIDAPLMLDELAEGDLEPEHPEAVAYVRAQWPRIAGLAQLLLGHGGVLHDPQIMPPLPDTDEPPPPPPRQRLG